MLQLKIPPSSDDAEQAIIGSMILDPEYSARFCMDLDPEIFFYAKNKTVFSVLVGLVKDKKKIDPLILSEIKEIKDLGGETYVLDVIEKTPSVYNIESHIEIVHNKYIQRQILNNHIKTNNDIKNNDFSVDNYLKDQLSLSNIINNKTNVAPELNLTDHLREALYQIEHGNIHAIKTGLNALDNKIGGFYPGDLIVIGGRPSMGKTALVMGIISFLADQNKKSIFFSLEMPCHRIVRRLLSIKSGVVLEKLKNGNYLAKSDHISIAKASSIISSQKNNIILNDTAGISMSEIKKQCYAQQMKNPIDIVFIDYLQRINHVKTGNRHHEVGDSIIAAKTLARDLEVPVVMLSQLNRSNTQGQEQRPSLSRLKESGDIEQEADIVLFPFRPSYYDMEGGDEIIIDKHRDGETGKVMVQWVPNTVHYQDIVKNH